MQMFLKCEKIIDFNENEQHTKMPFLTYQIGKLKSDKWQLIVAMIYISLTTAKV